MCLEKFVKIFRFSPSRVYYSVMDESPFHTQKNNLIDEHPRINIHLIEININGLKKKR